MPHKKYIDKYIDGAWNVICDRCGRKRKNFQCTMQMIPEQPNQFVCTDGCLDEHNAQHNLRGVADIQNVPIVRDDTGNPTNFQGAGSYSSPITAADLQNNGVK